jgi:ribonucleotide monophosphatase NagD (HAD superfamily)
LRAIYNQMLEFDDDIENEDYAKSLEEEIEILDEAYRNAYLIAVGEMTVAQLLDKADEMIFLPFDPSAPETFSMIVDDIIQYFADTEEYEKCAELVKIKEKFDDLG